MTMRKALAGTILGTLISASVLAGFTGTASATDRATPDRPNPTPEQCQKLHAFYNWVKVVNDHVKDHVAKFFKAIRAKAEAAGRADLVAKIDATLAKLREFHQRLVAWVQAIHNWFAGRCQAPPALDPVT